MRAPDIVPLRLGEPTDVADAEGGGGHGDGGAGDAIGRLEVVGRGEALEAIVHLGPDRLAQRAAFHRLAAEGEGGVLVPGPEVHQLERELVVVLERVDESRGVDLVGSLQAEHEAQELGVAGDEGVLVSRAGDEVVGEIRAALGHRLDVLERQVELLESEASELAHQAGDELVGGDRERMSFGPGAAVAGADLDAEEAVGVEAQHALAQGGQRVDGVSRHQSRRREGGVEPVEGRLPFLEVVQVHPAPALAVGADDGVGGRPVGLLDARLVEDGARELPDDIASRLEGVHRRGPQVDRVLAGRHRGEQAPVRRPDLHHVVEARVVAVAPLGETEVGALAAVAGDDVADEHGAVVARVPDHGLVLLLGAEARVDLTADAVEVAVHGRRVLAPAKAAGPLHGTGVHAADADVAEDAPELGVAQALQHRLARPRDLRRRVRGEPHRSQRRSGARLRRRIGMLPELSLARVASRGQLCLVEHGALYQPADVDLAGDDFRRLRRRRRTSRRGAGGRGRPGRGCRLAGGSERSEERGQGEEDAAQAGRGCGCHHRAREQKSP